MSINIRNIFICVTVCTFFIVVPLSALLIDLDISQHYENIFLNVASDFPGREISTPLTQTERTLFHSVTDLTCKHYNVITIAQYLN